MGGRGGYDGGGVVCVRGGCGLGPSTAGSAGRRHRVDAAPCGEGDEVTTLRGSPVRPRGGAVPAAVELPRAGWRAPAPLPVSRRNPAFTPTAATTQGGPCVSWRPTAVASRAA